ncbi:MAG: transposase [Planctomycetota bacterium]|jgi:hypothetical protein
MLRGLVLLPETMGATARADRPPLRYEARPGAASKPLPFQYQRHEPEKTPLYRVVQENLETLLEDMRARTEHGFGYPRHVEKTFYAYLDCGLLQAGFTRIRCPQCGFERIVAHSCKKRGVCSSCEARRMADTAAHLVDRVLPLVPFRQWVQTLPIPVRLLVARDSQLLSDVLRIFQRRVSAWYRLEARRLGLRPSDVQPASVTAIQLFGGALNTNPHFHSIFADGVFCERADGVVEFVPALSPTDEDVVRICEQVAWRVQRLVERRLEQGSLDEAAQEADAERQLAFAPLPQPPRNEAGWEHPDQQGQRGRRSAMIDGFSLHADVSVAAEHRKGLERLCRYALRSSFSLQRLSVLPDGQVCYRLKRPWPTAGGATELVLDPVDFLRRLARLIPAPRANLVRYGGAFSSNSSLRGRIVPRVPKPGCTCRHGAKSAAGTEGDRTLDLPDLPLATTEADAEQALASGLLSASALGATNQANQGSIQDEPLLPALLGPPLSSEQQLDVRDRYLDWASLLKRVFDEDILLCPRCSHRPMRVIAAIDDPPLVKKILAHLGLPCERPVIAPARSPPQLELDEDFGDIAASESEFDVN